MKIGVFDSGLGGLTILRSFVRSMPEFDYIYLGDTARVPYGNRSRDAIYQFVREAVDYLFDQDCRLVILACNTASAEALRKIQREYLPRRYPDRRVLGVIIPTAEEVAGKAVRRVGILATHGTVSAGTYVRELKKIDPHIAVYQQAAPLLVPLIENDAKHFAAPILESYLRPLMRRRVDAIVLGCTHYPMLKREIRAMAKVPVISQDELIARKLKNYLNRHPEIARTLSKKGTATLFVTDLTDAAQKQTRRWFGKATPLKKIRLQSGGARH